jgi:tetratricopeptide (TPR) repeat protein
VFSENLPDELAQAKELVLDRKMDEALDIITKFEQNKGITPENQLSILLLRGRIHAFYLRVQEVVELGEKAHQLSKQLGIIPGLVEAFNLKAYIAFTGPFDLALEYIKETERLMDYLPQEMQIRNEFKEVKFSNMYLEFVVQTIKSEYDQCLEKAKELLSYAEEIGEKEKLALSNSSLAWAYLSKVKPNIALDYAFKALDLFKDLGQEVNIAICLSQIGETKYYKGELNQSLDFFNRSLSINNISDRAEAFNFSYLGRIYREKGELKKSIENFKQASKIAEESKILDLLALNLMNIGSFMRMQGDIDQAVASLKRSIKISEELGTTFVSFYSFLQLVLVHLDENSIEEAQRDLFRLRDLDEKLNQRPHTLARMLAEALILKKLGRTRNWAKSETLLMQIIEEGRNMDYQIYVLALISLCNHLLEELTIFNDQAILDEIYPLINKLIRISERQNSFSYLAEVKLLQAKLALIRMEIEETQRLLIEAQQIAEDHGLNLLAQKISSEHDNLLERVDEWKQLKKIDAPMSERVKLASFDGVVNRLQGKQAVDPPEIVNEDPILLLIMDNSGVTHFNHPFITNWDYSDLFSSFMSAFNTFSSEIFSKSIDRIRIGENTILINSVEPFLACYVIKGQSYPALQKLTRFTEAIKKNSEIWQVLNESIKTSEIIDLDKISTLKTVINEIFTQ